MYKRDDKQVHRTKNVKKLLFLLLEVVSVCGYLFCLYAGVTAKFPFLNEYTEGNIRDGSGGYLWETLGLLFWTGAITFIFIPNKRYNKEKEGKILIFIMLSYLILIAISFIRAVFIDQVN